MLLTIILPNFSYPGAPGNFHPQLQTKWASVLINGLIKKVGIYLAIAIASLCSLSLPALATLHFKVNLVARAYILSFYTS